MDVVDFFMPPDEAFIVEVVVSLERVMIEVDDITFLPEGVPSANSVPAFSHYAEMTDIVSYRWLTHKPG